MNEQWLKWATEIQAIAQTGLAYATDVFDQERYTRLREISGEIVARYTDLPMEKVANLFCNEEGYQTPKIDTRAVVVQDGKILLVQERSGRWALPGGWADIGLTLAQNVAKETKEEAGLDVTPRRVLAIQDHAKHNHPQLPWSIWKIFVACDVIGGQFEKNIETTASGYFALDSLPPLDAGKTTREQVEMCTAAVAAGEGPGAAVVFD